MEEAATRRKKKQMTLGKKKRWERKDYEEWRREGRDKEKSTELRRLHKRQQLREEKR